MDLNCDLGEGIGNAKHDPAIMGHITSANIACGAHAGDLSTMSATVAAAVKAGVVIGAHPGYADRENFGRVSLTLPPGTHHGLGRRAGRRARPRCARRTEHPCST